MTDIDFDELDRAVNSLMNKQQAERERTAAEPTDETGDNNESSDNTAELSQTEFHTDSPSDNDDTSSQPAPEPEHETISSSAKEVFASPEIKPLDASMPEPTLSAGSSVDAASLVGDASSPEVKLDVPSINQQSSTPTSEDAEEPATEPVAPKIIRRASSGRFMDVVRPASNAVHNKKMVSSPARPTNLSLTDEAEDDVANFDILSGQDNSKPSGPKQDIFMAPGQGHFGSKKTIAPLPKIEEVEEVDDSNKDDESEQAGESMAAKIAQSLASSNQDADLEPLTSPFIANPEVEKRPLGGLSVDLPAPKNDELDKNQADDNPQTDDSRDGKDEESTELTTVNPNIGGQPAEQTGTDLPPELSKDVMAVESLEVEEPEATEDQPAPENKFPSAPQNTSETVAEPVAGDIPQQYPENNNSEEPQPAPMFEAASAEPKQLKHQEKKKSGWLSVLLILLFLAIGVAAGASAYYLLVQ